MRLSRFIAVCLFITVLSLSYVWQQTEIFKLAYNGQKNFSRFQDLLDKNSILRYNLKKQTSLISIGSRISQSGDFRIPDNYCLVKLDYDNLEEGPAQRQENAKVNLVAKFFSIKRQAEASSVGKSLKVSE